MKKFALLFLSVMLTMNLLAQGDKKNDIILKKNGEEIKGKLLEVSETEIKFSYEGETTVYKLKKADILKITHASGRVEMFNNEEPIQKKNEQQNNQVSGSTNNHNKIAILPFSVIRDNENSASDAMTYKVQTDAYTYLAKHSAEYTVLDPRTTNALLIKAGITKETIMGYTMQELCTTLGVEYIVDGSVSINRTVQTSSSSGSYNNSTNNNNKNSNNRNQSGYVNSSSTSAQRYQTSVTINIFNDRNDNIYNQSHKAFLTSVDASYNTTLEYLLKRCPLYRK